MTNYVYTHFLNLRTIHSSRHPNGNTKFVVFVQKRHLICILLEVVEVYIYSKFIPVSWMKSLEAEVTVENPSPARLSREYLSCGGSNTQIE